MIISHKVSIVLELDVLYEKISKVKLPYRILREENGYSENGKIIWYGLESNWKFFDNKWYITSHGKWVECDKPIYESIYQQELRKMKLKRII